MIPIIYDFHLKFLLRLNTFCSKLTLNRIQRHLLGTGGQKNDALSSMFSRDDKRSNILDRHLYAPWSTVGIPSKTESIT